MCENLDYAGHTDWHLPNLIEMLMLMNCGGYAPTVYTAFPVEPTNGGTWWTSTPIENGTNNARFLTFSGVGSMGSQLCGVLADGGKFTTGTTLSFSKWRPVRSI
jgi:hypothetical protein